MGWSIVMADALTKDSADWRPQRVAQMVCIILGLVWHHIEIGVYHIGIDMFGFGLVWYYIGFVVFCVVWWD